jgi:hypothetical protein
LGYLLLNRKGKIVMSAQNRDTIILFLAGILAAYLVLTAGAGLGEVFGHIAARG